MTYALDTNCLARWLLNDIPEQARAIEKILLASVRVHVSDLAISELHWLLSRYYQLDTSTVTGLIRAVIEHKNISCNKTLFRLVLDEIQDSPKVSFNDLCMAYYTQLSDADKLLSFDKTLVRRLPKLVDDPMVD